MLFEDSYFYPIFEPVRKGIKGISTGSPKARKYAKNELKNWIYSLLFHKSRVQFDEELLS